MKMDFNDRWKGGCFAPG